MLAKMDIIVPCNRVLKESQYTDVKNGQVIDVIAFELNKCEGSALQLDALLQFNGIVIWSHGLRWNWLFWQRCSHNIENNLIFPLTYSCYVHKIIVK